MHLHLRRPTMAPPPTLAATLLLATLLVAVPPSAAAAGPAAVDLGRATGFAILAGAGVVATGASQVTGDVGAYPRPAVADRLGADVHGVVHRGGSIAELAQADLADAYVMAATATPTSTGLGGAIDGVTLVAGVYALAGDQVGVRGRVVLDGGGDPDATWIFQAPADLVTSAGSTIDLVNGAQACNVFWQVGGKATLGADSTFAGTVLGSTAVTVDAGATIDGRILATTGRVSLGGSTIALPLCVDTAPVAVPVAAPVAAAVAPEAAEATMSPPSSPIAAPADSSQPWLLPIAAIGVLILAVLLDGPRRGPRPAAGPW